MKDNPLKKTKMWQKWDCMSKVEFAIETENMCLTAEFGRIKSYRSALGKLIPLIHLIDLLLAQNNLKASREAHDYIPHVYKAMSNIITMLDYDIEGVTAKKSLLQNRP